MNHKELTLISDILAHSAEEILSRNNESRVDVIIFSGWTEDEKQEFLYSLLLHDLIVESIEDIPDVFIMQYFHYTIEVEEFTTISYNLLIDTIDMACTKLSRYGCNDITESIWDNWTLEERQAFLYEYHNFNGDIEEYNPNRLILSSDMILFVLKKKLIEEFELRGTKPKF